MTDVGIAAAQDREHVDRTSVDVNEERVQALKSLIPEAFTEGKIDFNQLKRR